VDPNLAGTNQPYEFANNEPVDQSDPTGLSAAGLQGIGSTIGVQSQIFGEFWSWMKTEEGTCSATGKWCMANGQCQIGYGHDATTGQPCGSSFTQDGEAYSPPLSGAKQGDLLSDDLSRDAKKVSQTFPIYLNPVQLYALTSFAFNLGTGYFAETSKLCGGPCSLYDYIVGGGNNPGTITADFENYAHGPSGTDQGLANRRYDESLMYNYGEFVHTPYSGVNTVGLVSGGCGSPGLLI
jgi:GH24 family phage-related lysozyme (muramidase)